MGLNIADMKELAIRIRLETIKEIASLGFGHIGGSMSICETLAVLYGGELRCNPEHPEWEERDRLIVSKGHSGPAVYAALALRGFFPLEMLQTLNRPGTHLPSHCDRLLTPGIDMTTGSLGQGLSVGVGLSLANRISRRDSYTYVIVGDGELQEGQNWEAAMTASQMRLNRLILFCDSNKVQMNGRTGKINDLSNLSERLAAFGWFVQSVDGNNLLQVLSAVHTAKEECERPCAIVLNTTKGYGCQYALSQPICHSLPMTPENVQADIERLENELSEIKREGSQ